MKRHIKFSLLAASAAVALAGCAMLPPAAELDKLASDIVQSSFRDQGIAKVASLRQDDSNKECSAADMAGKPIEDKLGKAIEEANLKTVKLPSDGAFLGDWRLGEQVAQNGRGMTWTDPAGAPSGGSCYNCHQIGKAELSFGTIGPSLHNYGKIRGVSDPASPGARPMLEYTWGKIWNAKAYNACSGMPRFGHAGVLSEKQIKDIMALLLDPRSPVNQ